MINGRITSLTIAINSMQDGEEYSKSILSGLTGLGGLEALVNTSTNIYFGKLHYGPKIILKFSKGGGRIFKVNFKRFKRFGSFG